MDGAPLSYPRRVRRRAKRADHQKDPDFCVLGSSAGSTQRRTSLSSSRRSHRSTAMSRLVVAGNGPRRYTEQLRRLALKVGIADRVTWLGFIGVDAKSDFLGSIDVLAMPSAYECFGVAAVEAMSAAVPVIVTPTVGISDAVARHGAGVVALPDREISRLQWNGLPWIRRSSSVQVLLHCSAAAEFSLDRHGASLLREYFRLLSPGDKPSPTTEEVALREQSEAVDA